MRATPGLAPAGCQAFGVLRVEAVAEHVRHDLVGQHLFMPGMDEPEHADGAAQGLEQGGVWYRT